MKTLTRGGFRRVALFAASGLVAVGLTTPTLAATCGDVSYTGAWSTVNMPKGKTVGTIDVGFGGVSGRFSTSPRSRHTGPVAADVAFDSHATDSAPVGVV